MLQVAVKKMSYTQLGQKSSCPNQHYIKGLFRSGGGASDSTFYDVTSVGVAVLNTDEFLFSSPELSVFLLFRNVVS